MNQYTRLDELILQCLKGGGLFLIDLYAGDVRRESERISETTGREAFRVIDGRLQKLRKSGLIEFNSKTGWAKK